MIVRQRERSWSRAFRFTLVVGTLGAAALWPASAQAQSAAESATAQALFERAKRLMAEGNYADACPLLEESERVEQRSGTRLNLAECYERTQRYASAWSMFLNAAALAKGNNPEREAVARERAAALVAKLSNLVIVAPPAAPPGLEITRDGVKVGAAQLGVAIPADGGAHAIEARAPGKQEYRTQVTLKASGQTLKVEVPNLEDGPAAPAGADMSSTPAAAAEPEPPPSAASDGPTSGLKSEVIVGLVATGALAAGTVVTGIFYNSKQNEYDTANAALAPDRADLRKQVNTLGVVNLALLGGTLVSAGVTALLWAQSPSKPAPSSAHVELGGVVLPGLALVSARGRL
jgi:hypothetical protein